MKVTTKPFNIFNELKTERDIEGFIQAAIEDAKDDTDPSILVYCLGVAAQARGMLKTAEAAKVNRAGLYRSFGEGGDPKISTFNKVARALGYRLTLEPLAKQ